MIGEGVVAKQLVKAGEENQCERPVAPTRNQHILALSLEKTVEGIVFQDAGNSIYPLGGEHVVGDHNGVVLHKTMRKRVGIQQKSESKQQQALHPRIGQECR